MFVGKKNKANIILHIINKGVSNKSTELISKLYSSYIKPQIKKKRCLI